MSNIDKLALRIPERKKHNWGQAVMRDCDFCQQWALTVRHSDGGRICASCCDSEYTTALSSALVVVLDELEAKDKRIAELEEREKTLRTVGVMSKKAFERLEGRESRFIALWPRPEIYLPRKRPEDGVIVYARVAGAAIGE